MLFLAPFLATAQEKEIKGRVIDSDGAAIAGASVLNLRSLESFFADDNGEFRVSKVQMFDSLEIRAVGYEVKRIVITEFATKIIVVERDYTSLEDVKVETGYFQIPKVRSTGSFSTISAEKLNEQVGATILDRLPYIASGVTKGTERINSLVGLMVRGLSTATLTISKPLIVVDNFPYEGDIDNLNPNDVESITVLKDAAAASIWGAQAGNGVIVIATKKGKFNQRPKVEANFNITTALEPNLYRLPLMSPSETVDFEIFLFSNRYNFIDTLRSNRPAFSPVYEILFARRNGKVSAADSAAAIDRFRSGDILAEYRKYMYRPSLNRQVAASLTGGSKINSWSFSMGGDMNIGNLHEKTQRVTFVVNNTFKPIESLQITTSIMYANNLSESGRPGYGSINYSRGQLPLYTRFADEDGNEIPVYKTFRKTLVDTLGQGLLLDYKYYPLSDYKHETRRNNLEDINANLGVKWQIRKWLGVDLNYRRQHQVSNSIHQRDSESYYTRELINAFTIINYSNNTVNYIIPPGSIVGRGASRILAQDFRSQLSLSHIFSNQSLNALLGFHASDLLSRSESYTVYGFDPELSTTGAVDYVNTYPHIITGSSTRISGSPSLSVSNRRQASLYSNVSYSIFNRYHVTASARRDASNLFGVSINDRWSPLWSVGVKWDASKESFFKLKLFDYLNARVTYGKQGNVDPSKVALTTISYSTLNTLTQTPTARISNYANPNLGWERVDMLNFGIDFSFWSGRVSGSLEHYQKFITDLYRGIQIDPTTGIDQNTIVNAGSMRAHGWEVQLSVVPVNKTFKWRVNLIANMNREKITNIKNLPGLGESISGIPGGGFGTYNGYSMFAYFAYRWGGLDPQTGNPRGYLNGDLSTNYNQLTTTGTKVEDLVYIGRQLPTWSGSISQTFSWRTLSLVANITYDLQYYFKRPGVNYSSMFSGVPGHSDYSKRWQSPGDELWTDVPSLIYPLNSARETFYQASEIFAEKGDHVRLNYIQLSYRMTPTALEKAPFKSVGLFANVNNLGIIWRANKKGLDPNYLNLPPQKSYSIGIRLMP